MVRLERIGSGNIGDVLDLRVAESQKSFVAPNDQSLMEAYIALSHHGRAFPFAVCDGDTAVGFCMVGYGADDDWKDAPPVAHGNYNLWRLMIGERFQGRGYGKAAMRLILDFIHTLPCGPASCCWVSYDPENAAAKALYAAYGFEETGDQDGDEVIAVRKMDHPAVSVRHVIEQDKAFWFSLDRHLSEEGFSRKVQNRMGYVLEADGRPAAILRWSLFWDSIPFCNMLYVKEGEQRKGYGRHLMSYWEREMKESGFGLVMTSTQSDEEAQHFYRTLGYQDCGALTFPFPGYEQPTELIMAKSLLEP